MIDTTQGEALHKKLVPKDKMDFVPLVTDDIANEETPVGVLIRRTMPKQEIKKIIPK